MGCCPLAGPLFGGLPQSSPVSLLQQLFAGPQVAAAERENRCWAARGPSGAECREQATEVHTLATCITGSFAPDAIEVDHADAAGGGFAHEVLELHVAVAQSVGVQAPNGYAQLRSRRGNIVVREAASSELFGEVRGVDTS